MVQIRNDFGAYVEHPCVTETQKHKATLPEIMQLASGRAAFWSGINASKSACILPVSKWPVKHNLGLRMHPEN